MYLHQKMIRIYADIVQNHTLPGAFPNFGGQCMYSMYIYVCMYVYVYVCVYVYVYVYVCVCVCVCVYVYINKTKSTDKNTVKVPDR